MPPRNEYSATRDEIVGRKVNDLMAEPYATEHDGYIARYEQTGEPRAIGRIRTVEGRRKNGEFSTRAFGDASRDG